MIIEYKFITNFLEICTFQFSIEEIEEGKIKKLLDKKWSIKERKIL